MIAFRYIVRLVLSGIPRDYWFLEFSNLAVDPMYVELAKKYCAYIQNFLRKGMGLMFLGPNVIGETSLMCEIGKHTIVNGVPVRYFTLPQYITAFQTNDTMALQEMEEGKLLLIDELDNNYIKMRSDFVIGISDS